MALDKAIDSARLDDDLTAVADAIRGKGGTSESLAFPDGFVSAVQAIQGGQNQMDLHVAGTPFDYVDNEAETLRDYAFYRSPVRSVTMNASDRIGTCTFESATKLESVSFENATSAGWYVFYGCTSLKTVYAPNWAGALGRTAFYKCTSLETLDLPKVTRCDNDMQFADCTSLKTLYLRGWTGLVGANTFDNCYSLEMVDFGSATTLQNGVFENNYVLQALILRDETKVIALDGTTSFVNTPLTGYGGTYSGHVYVPAALIPEYQAATNWVTFYEAYPDIFRPIEGSEYE